MSMHQCNSDDQERCKCKKERIGQILLLRERMNRGTQVLHSFSYVIFIMFLKILQLVVIQVPCHVSQLLPRTYWVCDLFSLLVDWPSSSSGKPLSPPMTWVAPWWWSHCHHRSPAPRPTLYLTERRNQCMLQTPYWALCIKHVYWICLLLPSRFYKIFQKSLCPWL